MSASSQSGASLVDGSARPGEVLSQIEKLVGEVVSFKGTGYFIVEPADWIWLLCIPCVNEENPSGWGWGGPNGHGKTMPQALENLLRCITDPKNKLVYSPERPPKLVRENGEKAIPYDRSKALDKSVGRGKGWLFVVNVPERSAVEQSALVKAGQEPGEAKP